MTAVIQDMRTYAEALTDAARLGAGLSAAQVQAHADQLHRWADQVERLATGGPPAVLRRIAADLWTLSDEGLEPEIARVMAERLAEALREAGVAHAPPQIDLGAEMDQALARVIQAAGRSARRRGGRDEGGAHAQT